MDMGVKNAVLKRNYKHGLFETKSYKNKELYIRWMRIIAPVQMLAW